MCTGKEVVGMWRYLAMYRFWQTLSKEKTSVMHFLSISST